MSFTAYLVAMFLAYSAADTGRSVIGKNMHMPGEYNPTFVSTMTMLGFPSVIATVALPIYAFFVLPWWQAAVGIPVVLVAVVLVTRQLLGRFVYDSLLWLITSLLSLITLAYIPLA